MSTRSIPPALAEQYRTEVAHLLRRPETALIGAAPPLPGPANTRGLHPMKFLPMRPKPKTA
jgi:hypothetical protein